MILFTCGAAGYVQKILLVTSGKTGFGNPYRFPANFQITGNFEKSWKCQEISGNNDKYLERLGNWLFFSLDFLMSFRSTTSFEIEDKSYFGGFVS